MLKTYRIRLLPTEEQAAVLRLHVQMYRAVWNWGLAFQMKRFESGEKLLSVFKLITEFRRIKKTEFIEIEKVSDNSIIHALYDLSVAYERFFKTQRKGEKFTKKTIAKAKRQKRKLTPYDMKGHPKFKCLGRAKESFYSRNNSIYFKNGLVNLEKIGKVKYCTKYKIPEGRNIKTFFNPRVSSVNGKWLLTVAYETEASEYTLNDYSVGIDLGIKELAVVSYDNGKILKFHNVNKEHRVKRLKKRLKRAQRKFSKSQKDSKNRQKRRNKVASYYAKLSNIRRDHTHKVTRSVVNLLPKKIVLEDLNIQGMTKNHCLARAIQEQNLQEFRRQIIYKSEWQGTEVQLADRFYPSSKTCSNCGSYKRDLKLKDRIFHCGNCGQEIDRDENASKNLEKYN